MVSQPRRYPLVSVLDTEDKTDVDKKVDTSLIGSQPISVIIPTLNEGLNIGDLLIRLDQTLTQAGIPYEVIVVDDHSTDDTIAVAEAIAMEKILPMRILTKQGRTGKSFSLIEGFAAAQYDVLVMMDGDLQHPPEILPDMLYHLVDADIVVADRRNYKNSNRLRGLLTCIFIFIFNILFGINTDVESGLKVFRRKVYEGLPPNPGRWGLDLHLVTQAVRKGNILINMPFAIQKRQGGKSKVKPLVVGVELLIAALQLKITLALDCIATRVSNHQRNHETIYLKAGGDNRVKRSIAVTLLQLIRFCAVGGLNTLIDLTTFNILVWVFPTHYLHELIFYNSLAYSIAAMNSFLWNRFWTFKQRSKVTGNQVIRFAFLTGIAIICNDVFLWAATNLLMSFSISGFLLTNLAKISAIAGTVTISYVGMRFHVFTKSEQDVAPYQTPSK